VRSIYSHYVLLVAGTTVASALKDQPTPVVTEIRFCVFPAVGELADVPQMALAFLRRDRRLGCRELS